MNTFFCVFNAVKSAPEVARRQKIRYNPRMKYYSVEKFDSTGLTKTVFTPREDGKWKYGEDGALDNYLELGNLLGITPDDMVRPSQTHTDIVRAVDRSSAGSGVVRPCEGGSCDGLVTNEKGLFLCTREADCVPVFMLDPVSKAVGMVHSGWKGTAKLISAKAVELMKKCYGTKPSDLLIYLGPCICAGCYEVGGELIDDFSVNYSEQEISRLFEKKDNGKYMLDVALGVRMSLEKCGISPGNITGPDWCTYHDGIFSSYRLEKSYTTHMLTGIMLI